MCTPVLELERVVLLNGRGMGSGSRSLTDFGPPEQYAPGVARWEPSRPAATLVKADDRSPPEIHERTPVSDSPDSLGGSEGILPRAEDPATDPATVPDPLREQPTEGYTEVAEPTLLAAGAPPTEPRSFEPPVVAAAADPPRSARARGGTGRRATGRRRDRRPDRSSPRPRLLRPPSPSMSAGARRHLQHRRTAPSRAAWRPALVAALVGAVVGALVAGGMSRCSTTTTPASCRRRRPATWSCGRPTASSRSGDIAAILKADVPAVVAIVDDGGPDYGGAAGTGFVDLARRRHRHQQPRRRGRATRSRPCSPTARRATRRCSAPTPSERPRGGQGRRRPDLPTIELGDSDQVQVGDDVVAIGNALALEGGLSVTRGIISGLHREVGTERRGRARATCSRPTPRSTPATRWPAGRLARARHRHQHRDRRSGRARRTWASRSRSRTRSRSSSELREGRQPAVLGVRPPTSTRPRSTASRSRSTRAPTCRTSATASPAAKARHRRPATWWCGRRHAVTSAAALGGAIRQLQAGRRGRDRARPRRRARHDAAA